MPRSRRPHGDAVDLACAIHRRAVRAQESGALARAEHWCRRALRILHRHVGAAHPDYVNVANALGEVLVAGSRYRDAEALFRQSVDAMDAIAVDLEVVHLIRLQSVRQLGSVLRMQARYPEAETHLQRAVRLAEDLGASHDQLSVTCNELAVLYKYTGRFDDAAVLYERALAPLIARGDGETIEAATLYHNIGGLAHARGAYADGEAPARLAVRIREAALGSDHPDVAADAAALAGILEGLGRIGEARDIYERALGIYRRVYAGDHYETAYALSALAGTERDAGDLGSAETHYREALAIRERLLGPRHPDVAMTLHNLAALLNATGRRQEARELSARAVAIFEAHLNATHPKVATARELWRSLDPSSEPSSTATPNA